MVDLTFAIIVILSFPLQGAPFTLIHHFTFFYLNRGKFGLKKLPRFEWSDFWFASFAGLLIFLLSIVFWNAFGLTATTTYITMLSLFILSEAWDVATFWADKKKVRQKK
jgi:hypothetical protein